LRTPPGADAPPERLGPKILEWIAWLPIGDIRVSLKTDRVRSLALQLSGHQFRSAVSFHIDETDISREHSSLV